MYIISTIALTYPGVKRFLYGEIYKVTPIKRSYLSKFKNNLNKNPTKAELAFQDILLELKLKFRKNKGFMRRAKSFCIVDFYLVKPFRLAVEIDGEYHNTPEQIVYDAERTLYLNSRKIKVIRFTNEQVLDNKEETIKLFKKELLSILYNHKAKATKLKAVINQYISRLK